MYAYLCVCVCVYNNAQLFIFTMSVYTRGVYVCRQDGRYKYHINDLQRSFTGV